MFVFLHACGSFVLSGGLSHCERSCGETLITLISLRPATVLRCAKHLLFLQVRENVALLATNLKNTHCFRLLLNAEKKIDRIGKAVDSLEAEQVCSLCVCVCMYAVGYHSFVRLESAAF